MVLKADIVANGFVVTNGSQDSLALRIALRLLAQRCKTDAVSGDKTADCGDTSL